MVVAKGWLGVGNGELVFSGYRISVGEAEKVLETDGGDTCNNSVNALTATELYT